MMPGPYLRCAAMLLASSTFAAAIHVPPHGFETTGYHYARASEKSRAPTESAGDVCCPTCVADALVIGAGPGGLAVATTLTRVRHSVCVFDSGEYRNAAASHMHNVVGWDHVDPAQYRQKGRADLLRRYGDYAAFRDTWIADVQRINSSLFEVRDRTGRIYRGRKLVLAHGVRPKAFPSIPGYQEAWNAARIFGCLFCEGYEEVADGHVSAVFSFSLVDGPNEMPGRSVVLDAIRQLQLSQKVTIYTNGDEDYAESIRSYMYKYASPPAQGRLSVESRPIQTLSLHRNGQNDVDGVNIFLEGGFKSRAIFINQSPPLTPTGDFHIQLGLALSVNEAFILTGNAAKQGDSFALSPEERGIYVVGEAAIGGKSASAAASSGANTGVAIAQQLEIEHYLRDGYFDGHCAHCGSDKSWRAGHTS